MKAKDWQQVAHLCVINCNVSQHIMNVRTEIPEILKFQEAFSNCNQESQTMKQRAYVSFFDCMDEIDKTVSEMARHRDGSAFIVSGHQVFILLARQSILVLFYTLVGVFIFLLQAAARWWSTDVNQTGDILSRAQRILFFSFFTHIIECSWFFPQRMLFKVWKWKSTQLSFLFRGFFPNFFLVWLPAAFARQDQDPTGLDLIFLRDVCFLSFLFSCRISGENLQGRIS